MNTLTTPQRFLIKWSNGHAVSLLLSSVFLFIFKLPVSWLLIPIVMSFCCFIYSARSFWTPDLRFGWANAVTTVRLALTMLLPILDSHQNLVLIALAIVIFALDGVDGYLARKFACASEFGEYFDKETDAVFILLLCWLLYLNQRLGLWILLPGLLRYLFVVLLMLVRPSAYKEPQTPTGKYIFAITVSILIFCFTEYRQIYQSLAIMMTLLLSYSFVDTLYLLYRSGRYENKT